MARFYRLSVEPTLFGDWSMRREWGRIGSRGQSREHWCATCEEAARLLDQKAAERLRRGYAEPMCLKDARSSAGCRLMTLDASDRRIGGQSNLTEDR